MSELDALRAVDFNWTRQLDSVWHDQSYHSPDVHRTVLEDLTNYFLESTREPRPTNEPLGRILVGPAGLGKTHLIGELRRQVWDHDGTFILLDLVGVTDFWQSVALGFLNSLQIKLASGSTQYDKLILKIASLLALQSELDSIAKRLRGRPRELISELVNLFLTSLGQHDRQATMRYADVVRALVLLISDDLECASVSHAWLQGMDLDSTQTRSLGFVTNRKEAIEIVRGISWLLSLVGPTLIAVDQIDAIINASNMRNRDNIAARINEEEQEARSIIQDLANGLIALHDVKRRSVVVISSLEASWRVLENTATVPVADRYRTPPTILHPIHRAEMVGSLIRARLARGYSARQFMPPYETWPFAPEAFETAVGFTPRQVLKACDDHRQRCVAAGKPLICRSFADTAPSPQAPSDSGLDDEFGRELHGAAVDDLMSQDNEDKIRDLVAEMLSIYVKHLDLPDDVDVVVKPDPDQRRPSLHGRLTFIFRGEGDREQHFCFRVLAHSNAIAFQSRLRAAMTASGVDRALKFRHLFILRHGDPPGGIKTKQLVEKFRQSGGQFIAPAEQDLRAFVALRAMASRNLDSFDAWLRTRRPLFDTRLFAAAGLAPPPFLRAMEPPRPPSDRPSALGGSAQRADESTPKAAPPVGAGSNLPEPSDKATPSKSQAAPISGGAAEHSKGGSRDIPLGHRYDRGNIGPVVGLPADLLPRHVAILAGSGSGKTVMLRRIVEEAALLGIPSIVLDTNNDLARLGDAWPNAPDAWTAEDVAKAADYRKRVEVLIWTPGRNAGRPMSLALLPDFAALSNDEDERAQAIEMARATLSPYIGATGANAMLKEGVLADALRRFAREGGNRLEQFIDQLSDLPDDVSHIDDAPKLASAMANRLRAAIATNPLLQSRGAALDPHVLLESDSNKTRISVVNFSGLASDEARQAFVNQLQMALFTWIKRNPSSTGYLYVLDEAQNFAPSQKATPCKESTVSLAAQARKYGLGMIFATQTPKGIDNKIVSNCTTHFYGRMSAPATIEAARELMAAKGGTGEDIGRLSRGEFYFSTEALQRPIRLRTPLCLSWHPANPLTVEEVISRARRAAG